MSQVRDSRTRIALLLLALVGAPAGSAAGAEPAGGVGLCEAQETAYFACQTAKGKWISICGSNQAKPQYRYGKPGAIELAYPTAPKDSLQYAHYFRAQTDYTEVTFRTHDAEYALFDYSEGRRSQTGVRVTRADEEEVTISCRRRARNQLPKLEALLPCDAENALNLSAEGCADTQAAVQP
jgi:hypothetical protein